MIKSEITTRHRIAANAALPVLYRKPDRVPLSAHSIFKKIPPRKRKSMESGNGARAERRNGVEALAA